MSWESHSRNDSDIVLWTLSYCMSTIVAGSLCGVQDKGNSFCNMMQGTGRRGECEWGFRMVLKLHNKHTYSQINIENTFWRNDWLPFRDAGTGSSRAETLYRGLGLSKNCPGITQKPGVSIDGWRDILILFSLQKSARYLELDSNGFFRIPQTSSNTWQLHC